jgi:hypothetical protein
MISAGPEKVVTISFYRNEGKDDVQIYWCGLDTIYNPIVCSKGDASTMKELASKLEDILGVGISLCSK